MIDMTPMELWKAIGAVIAKECGCMEIWDHRDKTGVPITAISDRERAAILVAVSDLMFPRMFPKTLNHALNVLDSAAATEKAIARERA